MLFTHNVYCDIEVLKSKRREILRFLPFKTYNWRKKMMQESIWAVEDQLMWLMEAYQRGMWDATDEEIERLKQIYLELESEIDELEG